MCVSYECGDYVLNDNASDDIHALRGCLKTIATEGQLTASSVKSRNRQLLRSCSVVALGQGYVQYPVIFGKFMSTRTASGQQSS